MATILDRDDRFVMYVAGGFSGGLMTAKPFGMKPIDISLSKIPDNSFERIQDIVRLLTSDKDVLSAEELEERQDNDGSVGDFGHWSTPIIKSSL